MVEFLALLVMSAVAVAALAAGISFFAQIERRQALGWAAFLVGCFLLFWALGLWEGAGMHAWGVLGIAFVLLLAGAYVLLKLARRFWRQRQERRAARADRSR